MEDEQNIQTLRHTNDIAIIGMAGRFPGAKNIEEFWRNLQEGVESISFFSDAELLDAAVDPVLLKQPNYVKAGAVLQDADMFDASFFGFTPKEALIIDPQHRLFLECAWEALESASYNPKIYDGAVGVYGGAFMSTYLLNLYSRRDLINSVGELTVRHGNDKDYLTTRVSYKLDLKGPSININTACSTSLVAIHLACQGLLNGECDMALAGGVYVSFPQVTGYLYQEGGILSSDGHCRAFDEKASGTIFGHGVGIVVLKRLVDAVSDGDDIYAVIKGSAVNNDGAMKVGYTAPGVSGQTEVIAEALAVAGVGPETITYIETHGTGTKLGDPIEIAALTEVFRGSTSMNHFCALGSVKTNIGHLSSASGVAGLIKTALMLRYRQLLPSLHFEQANRKIPFEESPFYVNSALTDWKVSSFPRRAGISSFGMGGTNAHLILEEYVKAEDFPVSDARELQPWRLVMLSARTPGALDAATTNLATHLKQHPTLDLSRVAYTLQLGRQVFSHRRIVVCRDLDSTVAALESRDPAQIFTTHCRDEGEPIAFLFPGQGSQYPDMGLELYQSEVFFRECVDSCAHILEPYLRLDLRTILYPGAEQRQAAEQQLKQTHITQPALFVIEYSLARLWMEWGITPQVMCGHSLGEYVAACLSGVFSLEDALMLIATRGRLMQSLPGGAMLSVSLPEEDVQSLLGPHLSLAAVNGSTMCVISGLYEAVKALQEHLDEQSIPCRFLATSHAFHSQMMDPIIDSFTELLRKVHLSSPRIPFLSNVTGTWITPTEATDPLYWAYHLRHTVRFINNLDEVFSGPRHILLEVGPGNSLTTLAMQHKARGSEHVILPSLRHPQDNRSDRAFLLQTVGKLWLAGMLINWEKLYDASQQRVYLPTYPFERQRYWIDAPARAFVGEVSPLATLRSMIGNDSTSEIMTDERIFPAFAQTQEALVSTGAGHRAEQIIAHIWQEAFGQEHIGLHDNFFALGGHSLLAMQVISRVRNAFQVDLPASTFFELATIGGVAAYIEHLLPTDLGQEKAPFLVRRTGDQGLPLSSAQRRLWFLDQMVLDNAFYNITHAVHVNGPLQIEALQLSIQKIVERHESLRTIFTTQNENLIQVILPFLDLRLSVIDVRELPGMKRKEEVRCQILKEAQRSFDLAQGPLLRVTVWHLDEGDYVLLVVIHHIVSDGWSMGVFASEVATCYRAFSTGQPLSMQDLPVQYADYSLWQQQWVQSKKVQEQREYWRLHLEGAPVLHLHTDHPHPLFETFRGSYQSFVLSPPLKGALDALGREEEATPFMILLAAFQILLSRYSGQVDFTIGTSVANRASIDVEELIGCFVNMLALRTDLSGNPTFSELIDRVRVETLAAYAHQELPFELLVDDLQLTRDIGRSPLFQVSLELHNTPKALLNLPGLAVQPMEIASGASKYELMVEIVATPHECSGIFRYNTDLFDDVTITQMIRQFVTLLEEVILHPQRRLADVPLLTSEEQRRILLEWNVTQSSYQYECGIYESFVEQVRRAPQSVAVQMHGKELTYWQLYQGVESLAARLESAGVVTEELIAVLMERSIDLLIAILAIWAVGATYLPLDASQPQNRLQQMLTQSRTRILLVAHDYEQMIAEIWKPVVLLDAMTIFYLESLSKKMPVDDMNGSMPVYDLQLRHNRPYPQQSAYVIYTSGSTGTPKGAVVTHQGLLNHLQAKLREIPLSVTDCVAQTASQCFDISVWQYIAVLLVGGRVLIVPETAVYDSQLLLDIIESEAVSVLEIVPSVLQALLYELMQSGAKKVMLAALRVLLVTGETLPPDLCRQWLSAYPHVPLLNAYGPTECSDDVTHYRITTLPSVHTEHIPIGRAIINTQLYALDRWLQPVPMGVPGELYIGGICVGRGYLHSPAQTAATFLPNPWCQVPGGRLYKTGDLVRYLPDGNLEFLGRIDHQIKLRGYRIELGEIEAALRQHPSIRDVVVQVREDYSQDPSLVAYFTLFEQPQCHGSLADGVVGMRSIALRGWLQERLPAYMVPLAFVQLEAMPLTPNGKLDRRALPAPVEVMPKAEEISVMPRTQVEEVLVDIWAKILGCGQIGIDEDFFELGGHSLLAIQVRSRVQSVFQIDLPLRKFFEASTVAKLAEQIEMAFMFGSDADVREPLLLPVDRDDFRGLSFAQQRLWFIAQMEPENPFYNVPVVIRSKGDLNKTGLQRCLDEIVQRHEVLRCTFGIEDGNPSLVIHKHLDLKIAMIDFRDLQASDKMQHSLQYIIEECRRPFDLAQGPLVRAVLLWLEEDEYVVLLIMHHIVSDGWSVGVLVREIVELYEAFLQGRPAVLPILPIQYIDYASWQRKWLQGATLESYTNYWKQQLAGAPAVLELPGDRPRPDVQTYQGAHLSSTLPMPLVEDLSLLSHQEGVTLFMVLLATFQVLLKSYTGKDDIIVGTDVANRNRVETEALIGFFVNQLVLRTDLSGDPSFRELLKRVRKTTLDSYVYQDMPFDKLVQILNPDRSLKYAPIFQVKLVFQNMLFQSQLELENVLLEPMDIDLGTAQLDINVRITKGSDGLHFSVEYSTDLFDRLRIVHLLEDFAILLQCIAKEPTTLLSVLTARITETQVERQSKRQKELASMSHHKLKALRQKLTKQSDMN